MMDNLVHDCYVAAGGVLGGSALQAMLPDVPVCYHIGSFVGRAVGGIVYKFSPYARLRQRAIDHEYPSARLSLAEQRQICGGSTASGWKSV